MNEPGVRKEDIWPSLLALQDEAVQLSRGREP